MSSSVPVIDFTAGLDIPSERDAPWDPTEGQKILAEEIIGAFKTVGFICLVNSGIDQAMIDDLIEGVKPFFHQGPEAKSDYTKAVLSNTGWVDVARENLNPKQRKAGDFKETFNFQPFMKPEELPEFMTTLNDWWKTGSRLALQVMKVMGLGLHLNDVSAIANCHSFGSSANESAIRVNFYPATANKELIEGQVRCGEHSDYGSITLLVQDSQGLEVMNRSTGEYESVVAPPGGVIVNIGDMMQRWTSDLLVANMHRVLVAEEPTLKVKDRVSIPFFAMPDQDTCIKCLTGQNKYEPVLMKDWLKMKIDLAFKERQQ